MAGENVPSLAIFGCMVHFYKERHCHRYMLGAVVCVRGSRLGYEDYFSDRMHGGVRLLYSSTVKSREIHHLRQPLISGV